MLEVIEILVDLLLNIAVANYHFSKKYLKSPKLKPLLQSSLLAVCGKCTYANTNQTTRPSWIKLLKDRIGFQLVEYFSEQRANWTFEVQDSSEQKNAQLNK